MLEWGIPELDNVMKKKWKNLDLGELPGHKIRRMHQLVVALFMNEVQQLGLTPVQFSSLHTICSCPGIDQKTLCQSIGYDTSTIGGVIDRLESRGLVKREMAAHDRRVRLITATAEGHAMLEQVLPCVLRSQERFLQPLSSEDQATLMRLMQTLIDANKELSSIPTRAS